MNTSLTALVAVALLSLGMPTLAQSQQPAPSVRRVMPIPGNSNTGSVKPLTGNYRILFTGKSGEKALGELSLLTAAPVVRISGPLDASPLPTSFEVSGSIHELEDGFVMFEYNIAFQVPSYPSATTPSKAPGSVQYNNHTCSGSLIMKTGKAYEILRAAGNTHSVTITPEAEK